MKSMLRQWWALVLGPLHGLTTVIARTKRHRFGKVVIARIAQDDHMEEEEALV